MEKLFEQLEIVRQDGATNMLDVNGVLASAKRLDCYELADWILSHTFGDYGDLIFNQFNDWKKEQVAA